MKILAACPMSERVKTLLKFETKMNETSSFQEYVGSLGRIELIHIPDIFYHQQHSTHDMTLDALSEALAKHKPDALIVGNNAVTEESLRSWRKAAGLERPLIAIRRGVDTRAIHGEGAIKYSIEVGNLPGINSPFVARHMIKVLGQGLQKNSKAAVLGSGNIGKVVTDFFQDSGAMTQIFSPSLVQETTRTERLLRKGLDKNLNCAQNLNELFVEAKYMAIAIPLFNTDGSNNLNIITKGMIESMASQASIVSASVPGLFTEEALEYANFQICKGNLKVRIDTAKRHAQEVHALYPDIQASHDEAFADVKCQEALDLGFLLKTCLWYAHHEDIKEEETMIRAQG